MTRATAMSRKDDLGLHGQAELLHASTQAGWRLGRSQDAIRNKGALRGVPPEREEHILAQLVGISADQTRMWPEIARLLEEAQAKDWSRPLVVVPPDGEPFLSWEDFCQYPEPYGLGLSAEQVEAILDRSNAGKRLSAVLGEHGTNQHTRRQDMTTSGPPSGKCGNSTAYLEGRLRRSHPGIAAALDRGEYRSVHAAAKAAKIVKDPDPLRELKRWWGRASDCDRAQFEDYLDIRRRERSVAAGRRASRMRTLSLKTRRTAYFSHLMFAATGFSAWPPTRTPSLSPYLFGASFAKYHLRASILRRDRLICSWSGIRLPLASMTKSPEPSSAISSSSSAMASKPNCRANA